MFPGLDVSDRGECDDDDDDCGDVDPEEDPPLIRSIISSLSSEVSR